MSGEGSPSPAKTRTQTSRSNDPAQHATVSPALPNSELIGREEGGAGGV